jgi:hypothetical protein
MADIEFLDTAAAMSAAPAAGDVPGARRPRPGAVLRMLGPGLWVLAALLVVIAPFRMLYRLSVRAYALGQTQQADGWGRLSHHDLPFVEHDPRYGVAYCLVAGLFLLVALTTAVPTAGPRLPGPPRLVRTRRFPYTLVGAAVGACGIGMLVATLGSALLNVQSMTNNVDAELAAPTDDQVVLTSPAMARAQIDLGAMVWLSVAALVVALAALVVVLVVARKPMTHPAAEPPEEHLGADDGGDETAEERLDPAGRDVINDSSDDMLS